tara:strand:+ start:14460 stop:14963 length:504 start_codon:yes stop_codon:yes gene_type:complete
MAYGNSVKTEAFSTVYSGETYPVGSCRVQPAAEVTDADASLVGDRVWMFVQADANGFTANQLLKRAVATRSFAASTSSTNNDIELINLIGVAGHDVAANQYGWIIVKGECVVKAKAGTAAGNNITSSDSAVGTCQPAAGGATDSFAVFGRALTAVAGGIVDAYVDFR